MDNDVVKKELESLLSKPKNLDIREEGTHILENMSAEEKGRIRSKCGTLKFVKLLKLQSQRVDRTVAGGEQRVSYKAVGIVLESTEDIDVPFIDCKYNKDTGIPPEAIGSKHYKAGEKIILNYYEFMFLMFRPEFAGFCRRDDDPYGVYFAAKMPKFLTDEAKLPTPTINFTKAGSPKEVMEEIDEYDATSHKWKIKPEYIEKFGALLPDITLERKVVDKDKYPTSTKATLGLAEMLKKKYAYQNY